MESTNPPTQPAESSSAQPTAAQSASVQAQAAQAAVVGGRVDLGVSEATPRPRKKYKSSTFSDDKPAAYKGRAKDVLTAAEYYRLQGIVAAHDRLLKIQAEDARARSDGTATVERDTRKTKIALMTKCTGAFPHVRSVVLENQIRTIRKRSEARKTTPTQIQRLANSVTVATKAQQEQAKELEDVKTRMEEEIAQRDAEVADAMQGNAEIAAECERLRAEVYARDAALSKSKAECEAIKNRGVDETESNHEAMIAHLNAKIESQRHQVEEQEMTLQQREEEAQTLRKQISSAPLFDRELQLARDQLTKTEASNTELSKLVKPKIKELQALKSQLGEAQARQRRFEARLAESDMIRRRAEEECEEANKSLSLYTHAIQVEAELRKLRMALRVTCEAMTTLPYRSKGVFADNVLWNNATMTELALHVMQATGSDRIRMERVRSLFVKWRGMRNDISHNPDAYKRYTADADSLLRDMQHLSELVKDSTVTVSDWPGDKLKDAAHFATEKLNSFRR